MKINVNVNVNISEIKKILIIQCNHFGDVLLNTGYLPFLRAKFPKARIDFLVSRPFHTIVEHNPNIDELVLYDKNIKGVRYITEKIRIIREVRHRKYDLILDQNRATRSAQIVFFSGAKYRIGFTNFRFRFVYNIKVLGSAHRYSAAVKFDLLKPLGIQEQPYELFYPILPESENYIDSWLTENGLHGKCLICLVPGASKPMKQWRTRHFAKLADMLAENNNVRIIILWAPGEERVRSIMNDLMVHKAYQAPQTTFDQAGALIRRSHLLICNDGGLNHLSVAVNTPSLAIFGNTRPGDWAPVDFPNHRYLFNPNHNSRKDDSFGISPEAAYKAAQNLLSAKMEKIKKSVNT